MIERSGLRWAGLVAGVLMLGQGGRAYAGGFEAPGLGAEAMGRGGAFAAKADDGTALEYNVAGFARQRGWRFLIEGKLTLNNQTFQRAGSYPTGMGNEAFAGQPYPQVSNTNGLSAVPVLAISTDFNYFDRWTFFLGLTTPNASDSDRSFPATLSNGLPGPQRYDLNEAKLLVVYPMLGAAVRVTRWFDVGLALQMAYGNFDLKASANAPDLGCTGTEAAACDAQLEIKTSAFTATGVLGLMFHPLKNLHIGANVRGPITFNTSGGVTAIAPPALPLMLDPGAPGNPAPATLPFHMPWIARLGVRYAFMHGEREAGDIELDGDYEAWHAAQNPGDVLTVPNLGPFSNIQATLQHNYKDTGSVRLGGAYNLYLKSDKMLIFRLGVFYDSSATAPKDTRVDFDTLDKIGYTLGLGFKIRGVTINAAYGYTYSPDRTVTNGDIRIINGTTGTTKNTAGTMDLPVYNNGVYHVATQQIFLGLSFHFDELMHKVRTLKYN